MSRRVARLVLAGFALSSLQAAHAKLAPISLAETVSRASRIVVARVDSVTPVTYWAEEIPRPCGVRYRASVERTFKGNEAASVEFFDPSLFPPLQKGERFLALLSVNDVKKLRADAEQVQFGSEREKAEMRCQIEASSEMVHDVPRTLLPFHDLGDGDEWIRMAYYAPLVPSNVPRRWISEGEYLVHWKEVARAIEQQLGAKPPAR